MAICCENGNKPMGSIKCGDVTNQVTIHFSSRTLVHEVCLKLSSKFGDNLFHKILILTKIFKPMETYSAAHTSTVGED